MTPEKLIQSCRDPLVQSIHRQGVALKLLARGLRPKQVAIAADTSQWKVNELRKGLMPKSRQAGPPMSAATILRRPWLRAGASLFVGVYQRVVDSEGIVDDPWELFLESYDIYEFLAASFRETWPVLPIDDACTIFMSFQKDLIDSAICEHHGTRYLIAPDYDRAWGCPYCSLAAGEWSFPSES